MANPYLFRSSLLCGLIVILVVLSIDSNTLICFNAVHGVVSSVANHYSTNDFCKNYDRLAMVAGFLINLYFIIMMGSIECGALMLFAACLYFVAKKVNSNELHATAHVSISACTILLLLEWSN